MDCILIVQQHNLPNRDCRVSCIGLGSEYIEHYQAEYCVKNCGLQCISGDEIVPMTLEDRELINSYINNRMRG